MHAHRFGFALRMPLPTSVFEISHQLLFLAIDRNHRLTPLLKRLALLIDGLELRIPILMRGPFAGLAQPLQALAQVLVQDFAHRGEAE